MINDKHDNFDVSSRTKTLNVNIPGIYMITTQWWMLSNTNNMLLFFFLSAVKPEVPLEPHNTPTVKAEAHWGSAAGLTGLRAESSSWDLRVSVSNHNHQDQTCHTAGHTQGLASTCLMMTRCWLQSSAQTSPALRQRGGCLLGHEKLLVQHHGTRSAGGRRRGKFIRYGVKSMLNVKSATLRCESRIPIDLS